MSKENFTISREQDPQCSCCTGHGKDKFTRRQFAGLIVLITASYIILQWSGLFTKLPVVTPAMNGGILILIGLLTSLHCVAMCGGICIAHGLAHENADSWGKRFLPLFLYNGGRIVSYTIIGGLVGALGGIIGFSGEAKGLIALVAGAFMIMIGLNLLGLSPIFRRFLPRFPKAWSFKTSQLGQRYGALAVGLASGLMPCGPLQAMQLYALGTGDFFSGSLVMFLFGIGTLPLMLGLGTFSNYLGGRFTGRMMQVGGTLVVVLGIVMLSRGAALAGFGFSLPGSDWKSQAAQTGVAVLQDDLQVVTSQLQANGYPEIVVQEGILVRWNIQAEAALINGCNETLIIPAYNIEHTLQPGDNIIEFMPEKRGIIPYSCWMGMIKSRIIVVEDISDTNVSVVSRNQNVAGNGCGGCCSIATEKPGIKSAQ